MTGGNLYTVSVVLWIMWGFLLLIKRPWKGTDNKKIIEVQAYIVYTLALIFIGTVFSVIGII